MASNKGVSIKTGESRYPVLQKPQDWKATRLFPWILLLYFQLWTGLIPLLQPSRYLALIKRPGITKIYFGRLLFAFSTLLAFPILRN